VFRVSRQAAADIPLDGSTCPFVDPVANPVISLFELPPPVPTPTSSPLLPIWAIATIAGGGSVVVATFTSLTVALVRREKYPLARTRLVSIYRTR